MPKITIRDVALQAGVGTATVERVINGRGNVREDTVQKVLAVVERLNYGIRPSKRHRPAIKIEVILVRPETSFFARLNQAFERIAASLDRSVVLHRTFVKESDPVGMAHHIANPSFRRSGVIICALDHPKVTESLRRVREAGVEVVQVVSRCDDAEIPYVGIDNYAAGRSAGFFMSGMLGGRSGNLAAICHSGTYRTHRERIQGFSDFVAGKAGTHDLTRVMIGFDDDLRSADLVSEALRHDPQIIGVYSAGGGDEGVATVLKTLSGQRDIFWVGHELTQRKKRYLQSGLLDICLDQAPETQARRSVDLILRKLGIIQAEVAIDPVRFMTITAQNV
ncbi:LacI family DNA-binding transcriptional regulator [Rhizobium tubonense]|uniref:LacI family transcriptional regulator n=1 Tax=Rhizobium tubonense TaxID=484088 RepID=A0A2W4CUR6_9HYPH|nr:LacI family DNA-binding transcriptional regulator [Rhizobium tubonense]PZM14588.1 LacI family transcriptional regulator [Rhizobium tubonense]